MCVLYGNVFKKPELIKNVNKINGLQKMYNCVYGSISSIGCFSFRKSLARPTQGRMKINKRDRLFTTVILTSACFLIKRSSFTAKSIR